MKKLFNASIALFVLLLAACSGPSSISATCSLSQSDTGVFGDDTARAQTIKEEHGVEEWVEIRADGNWDVAWNRATEALGDSIHLDVAWLEVTTEITNLYGKNETHTFSKPISVSRSLGGRLRDSEKPTEYLEVKTGSETPNYSGAECKVTQITVGNGSNPKLRELLKN